MMPPMARKLTDQIRQAVDADERTRYRICKDAELDKASMSRFMSGAGLSTEALDRLAEVLGLEVVVKRTTRGRRGRRFSERRG